MTDSPSIAPLATPASHGLERLHVPLLDDAGWSQARVDRWLWGFTTLGIVLRLLVYLLRLPIWTDEAKLATSLLDRGYRGLAEPLVYGQIAPVPFMWIQKTATVAFGFSEYSLRLLPLSAGIASVLLMRHLAVRLCSGLLALFLVAFLAVSYYPIRHSGELKPYATDLVVSLVLTVIAIEWLRQPKSSR